MRKYFAIPIVILFSIFILCTACRKDEYIADKSAVELIRIVPDNGYPGNIIKIMGYNFSRESNGNKVTINGKEAIVTEYSRFELSVIVPENEMGTYPVKVETANGSVEALSFTYKMLSEHVYVKSVLAGSGSKGTDDGPGAEAKMLFCDGLAMNGSDALYFMQCDGSKGGVRKVDLNNDYVSSVSVGSIFNSAWHGAFDSKGDFYVACKDGKNIVKVSPDGNASVYPVSGVSFQTPMAIAFDSKDNMYVADRNAGVVVKITNGVKTASFSLKGACSIGIDKYDRLIVGSNQIKKLHMVDTRAENPALVEIAGTGGNTFVDGNAAEASIGVAYGICCGGNGIVYFTDNSAKTVRILIPDEKGNYSTGKIQTIGEGFSYPTGIAVSPSGKDIYVADRLAYKIYHLKLKR